MKDKKKKSVDWWNSLTPDQKNKIMLESLFQEAWEDAQSFSKKEKERPNKQKHNK